MELKTLVFVKAPFLGQGEGLLRALSLPLPHPDEERCPLCAWCTRSCTRLWRQCTFLSWLHSFLCDELPSMSWRSCWDCRDGVLVALASWGGCRDTSCLLAESMVHCAMLLSSSHLWLTSVRNVTGTEDFLMVQMKLMSLSGPKKCWKVNLHLVKGNCSCVSCEGVLKDYLRELPSPLITKQLYEAVLDAMVKNPLRMTASGCENDPSDSEHTAALLDCLPDVEKVSGVSRGK